MTYIDLTIQPTAVAKGSHHLSVAVDGKTRISVVALTFDVALIAAIRALTLVTADEQTQA